MSSYRKKRNQIKETKLVQPETTIASEIKEALNDKEVQEVAFYSEDAVRINNSTFTFKYPEFWKTINDDKLAIGIRGVYFNKSRRVMKFILNFDFDIKYDSEYYNFTYYIPVKYEIPNDGNIRDFIKYVNERIDYYCDRIKSQIDVNSYKLFVKPDSGIYYVFCFKNNPKFVLEENSIDNCDKYNIRIKFEKDELLRDCIRNIDVSFCLCNYYAINFFNIPEKEVFQFL